MTAITTTPRVWIGCLAAYNAGDLHGKWVEASDLDDLEQCRAEVIRSSPTWKRGERAEEHAVMDYDGFGDLAATLGEWPEFKTLAAVAQGIEEYGAAFIAYIETCEPTLNADIADGFDDAYRGKWNSERDYAEDEICELGLAGVERIPESLLPYLDMEMVVREIFRHGTLRSREGPVVGVYVFETGV
jgi:antirestriction protein